MSWAVIHDRDNWLRIGRASILSVPTAQPGFPAEGLIDGTQAIPYRSVSLANKIIVIEREQGVGARALAVHDIRAYGGTPTSVGFARSEDNQSSWVSINSFSWEQVVAAGGSVATYGVTPATTHLRITVHPTTVAFEFSIGEIVLGEPVVADVWTIPVGLSPPRQIEFSRNWNTVENGPWRSKLAEPMSSYVLSFPPGRVDGYREIVERSEGGLRPVTLWPFHGPSGANPMVLHGHLSDEYGASLGLGGIIDGMSLAFRESMRPLR